jgi:hypothetical protein
MGVWNLGKTKETHPSLARASLKLKEINRLGLRKKVEQRCENYCCKKCNFETNDLEIFRKHHAKHNKGRKYDTTLPQYQNYGKKGKGLERVEKKCEKCGALVLRRITEVLKYPHKKYFCSAQCQFLNSAKGKFIDRFGNEHFYRSSSELKALELLNNDNDVKTIYSNKLKIRYNYQGTERTYIADFWVLYETGSTVIEVKSKYTLLNDKERNLAKFEAMKRICAESDITFKVWLFLKKEELKEILIYKGEGK